MFDFVSPSKYFPESLCVLSSAASPSLPFHIQMSCYRKANSTEISDTSGVDAACTVITTTDAFSPCCPIKGVSANQCLSDYLCWEDSPPNGGKVVSAASQSRLGLTSSRHGIPHGLLYRWDLYKWRMHHTLHRQLHTGHSLRPEHTALGVLQLDIRRRRQLSKPDE